MKKLLSALIAGVMLSVACISAFAEEPYDFRDDSLSGTEAASLLQNKDQLLFAVNILTQDDIPASQVDIENATKCYIFDLPSFESYLTENALAAGIRNSGNFYYVLPVTETSNSYYLGLVEHTNTGEHYPRGMELPKSGSNQYAYLYSPASLENLLVSQNLSSPEFIAPVTLTGGLTTFVYIVKNGREYFIPYSSEQEFPLDNSAVYSKAQILEYLDSVKQTAAGDETMGGGYLVSGSRQWNVWGTIMAITFVFLIGGVLWLRAYRKKSAREK